MREHEVPTHVQAEDRVLLWFTFPQIVAVTAVCAISYGAYRYAPVGPSEVRMALAVVLGLVGVAMIVGKVGGRRLPLVAADLLKYRLGARRYEGPVSQLVRIEPPAPPQPASSGPGPLSLMAKRARRSLGKLKRKKRKDNERRNGRMRWFGKRRQRDGGKGKGRDHRSETLESARRPRKGFLAFAAAALLAAAVVTVPQSVLADGHEPWRDEIDFELTEPVEGRRVFVEGLTVTGDRAAVTLRAATDIELRVRAFGGSQGTALSFWGSATLAQGERIDYSLPLHGPAPSFTFSWEDTLGQAGALTVEHDQIPYPLPSVEGELCNVTLTSLGWTPGAVQGAVESECVTRTEEPVELQTVAGHQDVTETALMEAEVTAITGTLSAATGGSTANVEFVPGGETRFRLPVETGAAIHAVTVDVSLEASPAHTDAPADAAHPPPGAHGASHRDGEPVASGGQRHRQRDDHRHPRRRNYYGAHRHRIRPCAQHDCPQGRDHHHRPPGARQGRGGRAVAHHYDQKGIALPGVGAGVGRPIRRPGHA